MARNLFVSFKYHGRFTSGGSIEDFDNVFCYAEEPVDEESLKNFTRLVEKEAAKKTGLKQVACTVLFWK